MRAFICLCLIFALSACNLNRSTPTPVPTPDKPRVEILAPPTGQQVIEGAEFDIDILGSDANQGIIRIELYLDERFLHASESAGQDERQYRVKMNWYARGLGWHAFKAIAIRADGAPSDEHRIALEVIPRQ